MNGKLFSTALFALVLSVNICAMEEAALRRFAEGGMHADTVNLLFDRPTLHAHVPGERVRINQFDREHYNARRPLLTQAKESFLSGLLQASFDTSHLPAYFGKICVTLGAQAFVGLMIAKGPLLFNRVFRPQEYKRGQKEKEVQRLAGEKMLLEYVDQQMKLMPQNTKTLKSTFQEMQKNYQTMRETYMQHVAQFMKRYASV